MINLDSITPGSWITIGTNCNQVNKRGLKDFVVNPVFVMSYEFDKGSFDAILIDQMLNITYWIGTEEDKHAPMGRVSRIIPQETGSKYVELRVLRLSFPQPNELSNLTLNTALSQDRKKLKNQPIPIMEIAEFPLALD